MAYISKGKPCKDIFTFPMIKPRHYQMQAWKAYSSGVKNIVLSLPRRSGKDITSVCMAVDHAIRNPNSAVVLMAPDRAWCRRIYFEQGQELTVRDPVTGYQRKLSGTLLDMCLPDCLRKATNKSESKIYLKNGSTISLQGSMERTFVGQRITFLVISETARHDPEIFPLLSPVMRESGGVTIYNGTCEDEINHFWKLIQDTNELPDWSVTYLTAEHTKEYYWVSEPDEDGIREFNYNPELQGKIHPETGEPYFNVNTYALAGQSIPFLIREYINIPTSVEQGSYYAPLLAEGKKAGRQSKMFCYNPEFPAYCAIDLGISDDSSIVFFQYIDGKIFIIDFYENRNKPIEHYIEVIRTKPYNIIAAFAPHDSSKRSLQTGMNLIDFCRIEYNFQFSYIPKTTSIISDIQVVRGYLNKTYFEEGQCQLLIGQLNRYHENVKTGKPEHDASSHAADAFRYAIMTIHKDLLISVQNMGIDLTVPADVGCLVNNVSEPLNFKIKQADEALLKQTMTSTEDTW